ncbi:hypothetical protein CALVIDRAFT_217135 [Calocera viscosa TUFC12733]|uniref:Uncharacterized protein n=1 Tax=Calocera viscosa (strain TUFC12733) TaxID=1330018 RepID=A0A167RH85_CALVF|nr:hypothetical protein CALVIDRAFT_217135 [Calocera viscosa TUFC12733]
MEHPPATAIPVTRENRFSDDFDRSWPRTAPLPPPPDLSRSGPQTSPTTDSARALFNERSNRLEPWGRAAPPHQQPGRRRESFDEHRGGFPGRDAPPHTNVHVLQKESRNAPFPPREPQPLPPHPGRQAGPPSGMIRQLPPHLSQPPLAREPLPSAVGSGRPPPHTATSPESASTTIPALPPPHLATSISTAPDSASLKSLSPDVTSSPALPSSAVDVGELHKMAMHSAAERAKRRRQEEEEERERERERARRKAQEIEERVKAAELEKHREAERQREAARAEQERRAAQEKQAASERRAHAESASAASGSDLRSAQAMPLRPPPVLGSTGRSPELPSMRADSWRSIKPLGPIGTPITPSALEKPPSPATPHTPHSHTIFSPIVSTIPEVLAISSTDDVEEVDFAEMGRLTNGMSDATPRGGLSHVRPYSERVPLANQRSDVGPWRRGSQSATMNPAHAINGASQLISSEPESFSTLPSEVFVLEDEVASAEEAPIPRVSVPGAAPVRPNMHSPPTHHLKPAYREPAMSALDDTMSRIKGALGAMQEARSNVPVENMAQELTVAPVAARHSTPVMLKPLETTTHVDRPVSPPLAWRSFSVRVPKKSLKLGPVPTSRLHDFLQVPPPASMDILSWVPPVKDMSIRTLSRDDLFHRKTYTRGVVNARVLLPSHHFVPYERPPPLPVVRLPSSLNQDAPLVASAVPRVLLPKSRVSSLAPRDVPHEARQRFVDSLSRPPAVLSSDGFMTDDLKLTSRSPPPDLSYPLSPPSEHSATGRSLSDNPNGIPPQRVPRKMPEGVNLILYKSPSRSDVTAGDGSSVRFTVSSELDGQPSLEHTLAQASTISPRRLTMDLTGQADRRIRGNDLGGEGGLHFMDGSGSTKSSEDSMSSLLSTVGPVATGSTSMPSPEFDNIKSATNATPTKTSVTPASGMTPNPWGKALLPDPEHLKAVWSHPGTSKITENSLKGISDEFPATLPVSVQELRSEDEDVPSVKNADELPTPAVTEPPVRPSFFDPHKSFQQVPAQPVSSSARFVPPPPVNYSATGVHGHTPYGGLGNAASTRPGPVTHAGVRPFPSYAPIVPGHSPSPPIMYTNASPYTMVSHGVPQTISPNMQQRIWVPQQGSPAASYVTTSTPYTPGMMPYGAPGTGMGRPYQPLAPGSKAPGGERPMLLHNPSMTHANSIGTHVSPPYHPVAGMEQMPGFSPPVHNALPQTHVGYTPHQANPPQQMYSVPIGGGRGAVRNTYDGYQPVPSGAFVRPSGW